MQWCEYNHVTVSDKSRDHSAQKPISGTRGLREERSIIRCTKFSAIAFSLPELWASACRSVKDYCTE